MQIIYRYYVRNALEWRRFSIERNGLERLMGGSRSLSSHVVTSTPMPRAGQLSSRPNTERNAFSDCEQQALWRQTLQSCGGDASRADVVLTAQRLAKSPRPAPLCRSKDWGARHPGPDAQLVKWLHETRAEWAARLSKSRDTRCEQCSVHLTLARPRKRVWCNDECSRAWYNHHRAKVQHVEQACQECETAFVPTRAGSKFCSDACRQRAHRRASPKTLSPICDNAPETAAIAMVPAAALYRYSLNHHRHSPLGRAA
jgi:hypothetical protein